MCSASPPKPPQPPPPPPRLVDEAVLAQRIRGLDEFRGKRGFLGTISKRGGKSGGAGITGPANAIRATLAASIS